MTFARNPGGERADEAGWPWTHRHTFLERLAAQGYAPLTVHEYRKMAGRLCEAIEKRALRVGDLDGATTELLRHAVLSGITGNAQNLCQVLSGTVHRSPDRGRGRDYPATAVEKVDRTGLFA